MSLRRTSLWRFWDTKFVSCPSLKELIWLRISLISKLPSKLDCEVLTSFVFGLIVQILTVGKNFINNRKSKKKRLGKDKK